MERRTVAVIFVFAFAVCALITKPHATSWNDLSRLAAIDALERRHTFAIEGSPFAAKTQDKYVYAGHTYSDKPPALALQGAAVAAVLEPFGVTLAGAPERSVYLIVLLSVGFWFALGCVYSYAFQRLLGFAPPGAAFVTALAALGTLSLPYATVLANHVPAGACALAGVYHLARGRRSSAHAALGAVFVALAYGFDASMVVLVCAVVVLTWGAPLRTWAVAAAVAAPLVAAQLAYNATVSGAIGPPAMNQASWSDPASPFHRASPSLLHFASPLDYLRYALYVLVGDKGLFSYTPLTVLCALGLARMWKGAADQRRIALAVVATVMLYVALVIAFTNDYGSLNYGERRYADVFFVLCIGLGPALAVLRGRVWPWLARGAAVASIALAMLGVVAPFGEHAGDSGYVFATGEFVRLAHRAPVQAGIDVLALVLMIFLVLRFWSSAAAPRSGTGRLAA